MAVDLGYDESGNDKIVIVSMQLATVQKAKKLKTSWREHLKKANLEFFHSIDFGKIDGGIFRTMNREERGILLAKLSQIIRTRAEIGLSVWVDIEQYNKKTTQPIRSRFGAAYTHAINVLMLTARLYCFGHGLGIDVNVLIEGGHRNSEQAFQILESLRQLNGHPQALLNILTVSKGDKKNHPLLQAADMLAYSEWQKMTNGRLAIYNALHVDGSRYRPAIVSGNGTLVECAVQADAEWKSWGKRQPKD